MDRKSRLIRIKIIYSIWVAWSLYYGFFYDGRSVLGGRDWRVLAGFVVFPLILLCSGLFNRYVDLSRENHEKCKRILWSIFGLFCCLGLCIPVIIVLSDRHTFQGFAWGLQIAIIQILIHFPITGALLLEFYDDARKHPSIVMADFSPKPDRR